MNKLTLTIFLLLLCCPVIVQGNTPSGGNQSPLPSATPTPVPEDHDVQGEFQQDANEEANTNADVAEAEERMRNLEANKDRVVKEGDMTGNIGKFSEADQEKFEYYETARNEQAVEISKATPEANLREGYLKSLVGGADEGIEELKNNQTDSRREYEGLQNLANNYYKKTGTLLKAGKPKNKQNVNAADAAGTNEVSIDGNASDCGDNCGPGNTTVLNSDGSAYGGIPGSTDPQGTSALAKKFRKKAFENFTKEKELRAAGAMPKIPEQFQRSFDSAVARASKIFSSKRGGDALNGLFSKTGGAAGPGAGSGRNRVVVQEIGDDPNVAGVSGSGGAGINGGGKKKLVSEDDDWSDEDDLKDVEGEGDEVAAAGEGALGGNSYIDEDEEAKKYADAEQINTKRMVPIWKIITTRYIKSAYPRLAKKKREVSSTH